MSDQTVCPKLGNDKRYPAAPSSQWDALNAPKAPIGAIGACGFHAPTARWHGLCPVPLSICYGSNVQTKALSLA